MTWIYCPQGSYFMYANTGFSGKWINNGTVDAVSNGGVTTPQELRIGYSSGSMTIENTGNWTATDPLCYIYFYYLVDFIHNDGGFNSTWTMSTSPEATIQFYNSNFWINGPFWSMGPTYYYSSNTNTLSGPSSTPPSMVVVNVAGTTIPWAEYYGVNIVINYDAWLQDSIFNTYCFLNSTTSTTAWITGKSYFINYMGILSSTPGTTFQVIVAPTATVTIDQTLYLGLIGSVLFINQGTIQFYTSLQLYAGPSSIIINQGLINLNRTVNFQASSYPGEGATTGTFVNSGVIDVTTSGGSIYYYSSGQGDFYQCDGGSLNYAYGFPTPSDYPYYSTFFKVHPDGYLGLHIADGYTVTSQTLFYWDSASYTGKLPFEIWEGDISSTVNDENLAPSLYQICYDYSSGVAYLYPVELPKTCSDYSSSYDSLSNLSPSGGVCSKLEVDAAGNDTPAKVFLTMDARCSVDGLKLNPDASCHTFDAGTPATASPSSGSTTTISFTFFVSCLAYLFFSTF
jgi:hypothetical protein